MINTTNSVVTDTTYYTFTDHLGSLALITGEDKAVLQENDFDAWGRKRNPTDWTFNSVPTANLFDRGYTGHEHLDIFGLINMNGRMYDPVLGKMLSPDLVVQDPGYTESYNRYTYCFNNPLKFTDPSGYEGEGWSQGVWNSHNVDWNAIGWYDMSIEERSAWYAGNVYNVYGNGIQSTGYTRPDYLGNLANQNWDNKDQMDRAMKAEGLYWNAYDQTYGTYDQEAIADVDPKGTRDPGDDEDIYIWISVFIPGDYSIEQGRGRILSRDPMAVVDEYTKAIESGFGGASLVIKVQHSNNLSFINWVQTISSNQPATDAENYNHDGPLKNYSRVDGDGPNGFFNRMEEGSTFSDQPFRVYNNTGTVYWKAELSLVVQMKGQSDYKRVFTVEWGFKILSDGTGILLPLRIVNPSMYHLQSIPTPSIR